MHGLYVVLIEYADLFKERHTWHLGGPMGASALGWLSRVSGLGVSGGSPHAPGASDRIGSTWHQSARWSPQVKPPRLGLPSAWMLLAFG